MSQTVLLNVSEDTDIKVFLGNMTDDILQESRDQMEFSGGGGGLSGIIVDQFMLELHVIKYFVSLITFMFFL